MYDLLMELKDPAKGCADCLTVMTKIGLQRVYCTMNCSNADVKTNLRATVEDIAPKGCICPAGANLTCEANLCPRKGIKIP